ncbi:PLP-dependent aminotransferase family protein [Chitinivorax sp. PXF-14]|uniref:aminotransferase-like domain-containing protein n=1 Tax=Chitinivorax sp. PXF-14 TaxID=3230488 RepID=UPI003467DB76
MFSERIDRLSGSLIREILALTQRPGVISFAGGLPASHIMPPFDFAGLPPELRQYGASEGEMALREKVSAHVRELGIDAGPDQVLILSGSQQGLDLASKLFIDVGTRVMVEAPTYLAALQNFKLFGATFDELTLNPHGIDADELAAKARQHKPACCYLIPTFQNPSGYCYSAETRMAVAETLDELDIPLIEDEPYRELMYDEVDRTPLCARLTRAPWIYLGSFSKTMMPGLRVGFLVASKSLMPYLTRLKQAVDLHTNRVGQWYLAEHFETPAYHAHIREARSYYRQQRDYMADALARHLGEVASWQVPPGGLFLWLKLRDKLNTRALLEAALKRDVAFMPGEPFFATPMEASGALRLNFSLATPAQIDEGIPLLREVVEDALVNRKS